MATEFLQVSGQQATRYQRLAMMDSPTVARIGVDAMLKSRPAWSRDGSTRPASGPTASFLAGAPAALGNRLMR